MPITIKSVSLEYKLLPIVFQEDGSASICVRKGYTDNGAFVVIEGNSFTMPTADTDYILNAMPTPGMSRRDDLAFAIYTYLVTNNHVEAGVIS